MANVTAVVKDPAGNLYQNALVIASFIGQNTTPGAGPYITGGVPSGQFETIVPGSTDSFGAFSMPITGNDTITPVPSTWRWTVVNSTGKISFAVNIQITGASQDISAALQAAAALLNPATGNISITGLTLTGNGTISGTLGVTGTLTAGAILVSSINSDPYVNGTNFATIDAALASTLCNTANGCHIRVGPGTFACPTTNITTGPIIIEGSGSGEYNTAFTNYAGPTILSMTSQTANCINASLPASGIMAKFTLRNFMIAGNKNVAGATSGDGIVLNGGTVSGGMRNTIIDNVVVQQTFGNGLDIKENVFLAHIVNSSFLHCGGHGIAITDVTANPGATQIYFDHIISESNALDGLNISGAHTQDINAVRCTFATNTNNGVNIVAGASSARFQAEMCDFEGNGNAGILIKDSGGHNIKTSSFPSDAIQLYGIFLDPPAGAGFGVVQLSLEGNNLAGGNLTKDLNITTNAHNCFISVQPLPSGSYTFSDPNSVCTALENVNQGINLRAINFSPLASGTTNLGGGSNAWSNVFSFAWSTVEFSAPAGAAGRDVCYGDSTAHAIKCSYNNGTFFNQTQTVGSGTASMTTAAIGSLACGATVTVAAAGVATTDTIVHSFTAAPAANPGELVLSAWPTSGNVNFEYCNPTAGSVTPVAATLNWRVIR